MEEVDKKFVEKDNIEDDLSKEENQSNVHIDWDEVEFEMIDGVLEWFDRVNIEQTW